jgi:hypothetical protein
LATDLKLGVEIDGAAASERDLNRVGDAAEKTGRRFLLFGRSAKKAASDVDELGDQARQSARSIEALDRKLDGLRLHSLGLARQIGSTGGDSGIFKAFRDTKREISGLQGVRRELVGITEEGGKAASTFAQLFQGGVIDFLSKAASTPHGAALLGAGALAGSVAVGGVAGGATLAGAGIGAVAGGVAGAYLNDPTRVGGAAQAEAAKVKNAFLEATASWVEPTISAIHTIGAAIGTIHFDKIFAAAARYIEPLASAAGQFAQKLGMGIEALVTKAGPEIEVLRQEIPEIGDAIVTAFDAIGSGSKGGADALRDMLHLIDGIIIGTGVFIGGMEDVYHAIKSANDATRDWVVHWGQAVDPVLALPAAASKLFDTSDERADRLAYRFRQAGDASLVAADDGTHAWRSFSQAMDDANAAAQRLEKSFEGVFGELMSIDQANLAVKKDFAELTASFRENGKSIDENSDKGRANREVILATIGDLERQREAAVSAGGGTAEAYAKANAAYLQQLQNLRAQLKSLGANTDAVDALISKYEKLAEPLTKVITVKVKQVGASLSGVLSGGDNRRDVGQAYASGTKSARGGWALVGELGPEIVRLPAGSEVYNSRDTASMLAPGPVGGSAIAAGGTAVINLPPMSLIEQAFAAVYLKLRDTGVIPA